MRQPQGIRRRPRGRTGVANIIAAVLLVAITVIAGASLWALSFRFPSTEITLTYIANAGLKTPVWGDPTDCVPVGYPQNGTNNWTAQEIITADYEGHYGGYYYVWDYHTHLVVAEYVTPGYYDAVCENEIGNFSPMNATSISITSVTPGNIPLSEVNFYFLCHNSTPAPTTTELVGGNLADMTWFPGSTTAPSPNAPTLGDCGSFDARDYGGGAFGTLYNRLGIFIPINPGSTVLAPGDTFILYVHTPGAVYDPGSDNGSGGPDTDDFHGAPSWCFTTPGACNIELVYEGSPQQVLANIPIYTISGAGE
ncbi:MAG: hypothetical protein ACREC5_01650 [Thermoplasmata archaeon]